MKIKTNGTKFKVTVLGNMSNEMTSAFESNLKAVYSKFGNKVASIVIDATGSKHYALTVTSKSGANEVVTFSTSNGNTVKVYMSYVTKFLKTA